MTTAAETLLNSVRDAIGDVVFGMDKPIHGICVALLNNGHILLEGVPGVGKTLMAKTLAQVLSGTFKRVQCTPDLMPSDVTGVHVYHAQEQEFRFIQGPVFADVLLVDEINRTGPKTQSALLEAMEENKVTIDRNSYELPDNFFVIATQNPYEFEGTYPLPESQLDRFLMRLDIDYQDAAIEEKVLRTYAFPRGGHANAHIATNTIADDLLSAAREQVSKVYISDALFGYVIAISRNTRQHKYVSLGLSTRGALALMKCARAVAALRGGEFVTPDDVKSIATSVISHRIVTTPDATLEGIDVNGIVDELLNHVDVPRE